MFVATNDQKIGFKLFRLSLPRNFGNLFHNFEKFAKKGRNFLLAGKIIKNACFGVIPFSSFNVLNILGWNILEAIRLSTIFYKTTNDL